MAEPKKIVNEVYYKDNQNTPQGPNRIGARFQDVLDTRDGNEHYSLAQFIDNYKAFMENTTFVYQGDTQPQNPHIGLWIDTSQTNAAQIGSDGPTEEEVGE